MRTQYAAPDATVRPLAGSWVGNVFLVTRPGRDSWVLRLLDAESAEGNVRVLSLLERADYPAPRLVSSMAGTETIVHGDRVVLITTYIEGLPADFSPDALFRLGETVGHLHALQAAGMDLPLAAMLPASDMRLALDWLADVEPTLPAGLRTHYDDLNTAIDCIGGYDHLSDTLIHNDCHPGNAIVTSGVVVLIDWQGAGLGPPIVDLGFLLISCDTPSPWNPPLPATHDRVEAVVDGYVRHRTPTSVELDYLPDAMRFRTLLYGAGQIASSARQGQEVLSETWWWQRYRAVDELADRVCKRFACHSERRRD